MNLNQITIGNTYYIVDKSTIYSATINNLKLINGQVLIVLKNKIIYSNEIDIHKVVFENNQKARTFVSQKFHTSFHKLSIKFL